MGLVRGLVEMHGGAVTAASQGKGKGSEFTVRLAVCEPEVHSPVKTPSSEPVNQCRVLIVDDRRDNEYLLKALVKRLGPGHETRSASDGPTALGLVDEWSPEVILLDLGLPGMSGLELAREIRKRDTCKKCLIVALTGYDNDEVRQQASSSGIDLYHLKPASITMIREIFCHPKLAAAGQYLESSASGCTQE